MQVLFTAEATAIGGRGGHVRSSDGVLDLSFAHPKEHGGPRGEATNPEQLFAAGHAACFASALLRVARERQALKGSSVTARVGIGRDERNRFKLQVAPEISAPGRDRVEIENIARVAHERSTRTRTLRVATLTWL
jgi:Ohr subfamily peroxiredoxin